MTPLWRDVFVPDHVVGSDNFTAEVGGLVEMPLALCCRFRTPVTEDDDRPPASTPGEYTHPDNRSVHDLVGQAVAGGGAAAWMLDVHGLGIYVSEADAGPSPGFPSVGVCREPGSDPAVPVPEQGTWTRVRGQLSIAEPYETGLYEPEAELLRRALRTWLVYRIVRLDAVPGGGHLIRCCASDIAVVQPTRNYAVGYLLDLKQASH